MHAFEVEPAVLFVAGGLLVMLVLLRHSRRRTAADAVRPAVATMGGAGEHAPETSAARDRWEVQMRDVARELDAQLATRAAIVEQLLREADERAQQLRLLLARRVLSVPVRGDESPIAQEEICSDAEEPCVAPCSYGRLPLDREVAIYALTDAGYPPAAIADRLDVPVGDVELMLSLRSSAASG